MSREYRQARLKDILSEYLAADTAMRLLEERLKQDPSFGRADGWRARDAVHWRGKLEGTFAIRMFAEFEAGLREVWESSYSQATQPPMRDLVDAIATRRIIADQPKLEVHSVRRYRNSLIHEGREEGRAIPIGEIHGILSRFTARLPRDW